MANCSTGTDVSMQTPVTASVIVYLALLALRSVSSHAIDGRDHAGIDGGDVDRTNAEDGAAVVHKDAEARVLDLESIFGGIAKSMVSRTGGTSSQVQHIAYNRALNYFRNNLS